MIRQYNIDVIAFQEVRSSLNREKENQLVEIKSLLPNQYRYNVYRATTNVTFVKDTINKHYSEEGIGVLSRLPILSHSSHFLMPNARDPDKNRRVLLHVVIKDNSGKLWNVLAVHLSYYRQQQCRNIAEIVNYIQKRQLQNVILLGDFNTYNDYEGPIEILEGAVEKTNDCWKELSVPLLFHTYQQLSDVWKLSRSVKPGFTFSNMPSPGFISRPDRIFVSSGLTAENLKIVGAGSRYKSRYSLNIFWERFQTIVQTSDLSQQGVKGYPCLQDCGPHGSCICGVCAAIGNEKDCLLPNCDICKQSLSFEVNIFVILVAVVAFHLFFGVLQIFIVAAASYTKVSGKLNSALGLQCCLLNPQLWGSSMREHQRKFKILRICRSWPLFNLPPYIQVLIAFIALYLVYASFNVVFAQVIELTYNALNEEFFPSDHLMLIADIS